MYKLHLLTKRHSLLKVAYKAVADRLTTLTKLIWLIC